MEQLLSAELLWAVRLFEFDRLLSGDTHQAERSFSPHEIFKLDKILDDVADYLSQVKLHRTRNGHDLKWYYEGRNTALQVLGVLSSIELYVSSILNIPQMSQNSVVALKLGRATALLLDAKKALLPTKKKVDIAANYHEVNHQIIDALAAEVGNCQTRYLRLLTLKLPSGLPDNIDLEQITGKMRLGDMAHSGSFSMQAVSLPAFSEDEQILYKEFDEFEKRLDPIRVSIDFLEDRVRDFNSQCGAAFPSSMIALNRNYERLRANWQRLLGDFLILKKEAIGPRWSKLFAYLIDDVLLRSIQLIEELKRQNGSIQISDHLGASFKLCSNTITLIHKAFLENVIYDKNLTTKFNDTLLPRWKEVNSLLVNERLAKRRETPLHTPDLTDDGLRVVRMIQRRTPLAESKELSPNPSGLGINLRLDVDPSPTVPYSISKTDRIVDLSIDADLIPKTSLRMALLGLSEDNGVQNESDDDTDTLVHATPVTSNTMDDESFQNFLRTSQSSTPSRIPLIASNYTALRLPVIKKMYVRGYSATRIPEISPTHPVFFSPDRNLMFRSPEQTRTPDIGPMALLSPPVFQIARTPRNGGRRVVSEGSIDRRNSVSSTSSLRMRADMVSLSGLATPNLTYGAFLNDDMSPDRVSLRSSSPERPESSMGSRFDDIHLTQPVKLPKKGWR